MLFGFMFGVRVGGVFVDLWDGEDVVGRWGGGVCGCVV